MMPSSAISSDPAQPLPRDRAAVAQADLAEIPALLQELFPIMRSITGAGVRQTHDILGRLHPLDRLEIPTGYQAFDWTVPKEWVFREAFVEGPDGSRVIDARNHPLHLVNYSTGFSGTLSRQALDAHLNSLPDQPEAIPYVTSYYTPGWGFCLSQRQRDSLPDGDYRVVVDCAHVDGAMTLSEAVLPGESDREVLFSTYTCHPSMANDELCAPIANALLLRRLAAWPRRRLTYRFVFLPETIGSVAYLAERGSLLRDKLLAGFAVANIGRPQAYRLKRSRRGDSPADRIAERVLRSRSPDTEVIPFAPVGSDERQYCSPGFDLPVAALTRGEPAFEGYHTSLDTLDRISPETVVQTVDDLEAICAALDGNRRYRNLKPHGEPQLGRYGLYPKRGSRNDRNREVVALLWVLNQADGETDLLTVAERSGLPLELLTSLAERCVAQGLLVEA